tara:strand:- start:3799 stop:4008 length:210 start_codon:yes stop_codon:yes gene_type:complete
VIRKTLETNEEWDDFRISRFYEKLEAAKAPFKLRSEYIKWATEHFNCPKSWFACFQLRTLKELYRRETK